MSVIGTSSEKKHFGRERRIRAVYIEICDEKIADNIKMLHTKERAD